MTNEIPPDPAGWLTEYVRLTGFTKPPLPPSLARDWWHALTGTPPKKVYEEPQTGKVELRGTHEGTPLTLGAEHGRLDITQPFAEAQIRDAAFTDMLSPFVELMAQWLALESSPPLQRLGFGSCILRHFPDVRDCRRELNRYLPLINMEATQFREFTYELNHERLSQAVNDLMLNRITKWSVLQGEPHTFAVHLEVDINTNWSHVGNLEHPAELFRELAGYAEHFARQGDRP